MKTSITAIILALFVTGVASQEASFVEIFIKQECCKDSKKNQNEFMQELIPEASELLSIDSSTELLNVTYENNNNARLLGDPEHERSLVDQFLRERELLTSAECDKACRLKPLGYWCLVVCKGGDGSDDRRLDSQSSSSASLRGRRNQEDESGDTVEQTEDIVKQHVPAPKKTSWSPTKTSGFSIPKKTNGSSKKTIGSSKKTSDSSSKFKKVTTSKKTSGSSGLKKTSGSSSKSKKVKAPDALARTNEPTSGPTLPPTDSPSDSPSVSPTFQTEDTLEQTEDIVEPINNALMQTEDIVEPTTAALIVTEDTVATVVPICKDYPMEVPDLIELLMSNSDHLKNCNLALEEGCVILRKCG